MSDTGTIDIDIEAVNISEFIVKFNTRSFSKPELCTEFIINGRLFNIGGDHKAAVNTVIRFLYNE